ncbi:hypothetical protein DBR26_06535 [Pseudomonas sp. HMWF007]|nr:hypothetical protein DBR26_06535 [Pseudomonas sp. HMWF007]
MWRGDLSPLGREAAPNPALIFPCTTACSAFTTAAQPNGDKSPRHNESQCSRNCSVQIQQASQSG